MTDTCFINLKPTTWVQELRYDPQSNESRVLQCEAVVSGANIAFVGVDERFEDLSIHLNFFDYAPKANPEYEFPRDAVGLLVFARKENARVHGWLCIPKYFDDLWDQVSRRRSCEFNIEVGPMEFQGAKWLWQVDKRMFIVSYTLYFRHRLPRPETLPKKPKRRWL